MKNILITGTAGFIGYHLAKRLLDEGFFVHGIDAMTDYYDVNLKRKRHSLLLEAANFSATECRLEDAARVLEVTRAFAPDVIVHLAAQAGVRYSLENPRAYLESNIIGTFNIMEAAREQGVDHLLMASTSSVYGANIEMPFNEAEKVDTPLTFYAATKKANESMAHSYAHLWNLPTTMFRFFTVYGPLGRPDLALFKFVDAMLDGREIDIYNHGDMYRDFTYVEDLVHGIRLLIDAVPVRPKSRSDIPEGDNLSPVAPYRVVNIGNSEKVRLLDFIEVIEDELGIKAKRNYMDIQPGDVPATWADASLLKQLTGYQPQTDVREGVSKFVAWFREYYEK
ncbi:MAG: NAD-dependent epimerase/dehydratase family protein [Paracoccaceae bacterium]